MVTWRCGIGRGLVVVGQLDLVKRHEGCPRHPTHRIEHPQVGYAGPPGRRHQLLQSSDPVATRRIVHHAACLDRFARAMAAMGMINSPRIPPTRVSVA